MNPATPRSQPVIALVAGEASGDQLGAALIQRLEELHPGARFVGVGGEQMREAGMDTWWDCEELAVFGLFEVLSHFPRLYRLRSELYQRLVDLRPDVFIGIDAPDFNLGLEIKLRRQGIRTVQYVSPTVWAWRKRRVKKIARAVDLVLCLFPFEPDFYKDHGVRAVYVGHPLADQIARDNPRSEARETLGLDPQSTIVALLPGSRMSEVTRLAEPMLAAARRLQQQHGDLTFIAALASEKTRFAFAEAMQETGFDSVQVLDRQAKTAMAAADVVVCASGTAALEVMLINRPMVVCYRLAASTYQVAKNLNLIKLQHISLPNILSGRTVVPELIQHDASEERIATEVDALLSDSERREALEQHFDRLHDQLQCDAAREAARAVSGLIRDSNGE